MLAGKPNVKRKVAPLGKPAVRVNVVRDKRKVEEKEKVEAHARLDRRDAKVSEKDLEHASFRQMSDVLLTGLLATRSGKDPFSQISRKATQRTLYIFVVWGFSFSLLFDLYFLIKQHREGEYALDKNIPDKRDGDDFYS